MSGMVHATSTMNSTVMHCLIQTSSNRQSLIKTRYNKAHFDFVLSTLLHSAGVTNYLIT